MRSFWKSDHISKQHDLNAPSRVSSEGISDRTIEYDSGLALVTNGVTCHGHDWQPRNLKCNLNPSVGALSENIY